MTDEKIVLFEFPDEVETFLNFCRKTNSDPAGFLPVALQPSASVLCKEKKLECLDTLAFFDNNSHIRAVQESHRMTRFMKDELKFESDKCEFPLENTLIDTFIYYSRFYINNYLRVLEIARGIKEKYPSAEIYAVEKKAEPDVYPWARWGKVPFLSGEDRLTAPLVEIFCKQNGMKYKGITCDDIKPGSKKKPGKKSPLYGLMKRVTRAFLVRKMKKLHGSEVVLFAASSYNLDRLGKDILFRIPETVCAFITSQPYSLPGLAGLCFKSMKRSTVSIPLSVFAPGPGWRKRKVMFDQIRDIYRKFIRQRGGEFVYGDGRGNCSLIEELNKKIEADLLRYLYYLCRLARGQRMILESLKPAAVISPVAIEYYQAWGELSRKFSIPSLAIPQKGLLAPQNEYAQIEEYHIGRAQVTEDFNYAAAQSPLTLKYLEWSGYKGTIMETANLVFSKIDIAGREEKRLEFFRETFDTFDKSEIPEDKELDRKIILFAPSMKSRKSCRFYVLETLDELLSSIRDIMDAVSKLSGVHLIVRIHPGEPIKKKEIETLLELPGNVSISDKGTFEDVLSIADLVISFSSTVIQESLLNGVPVVLYDKWKRYNHLDAPRVEQETPLQVSASYYIDEPGILSSSLPWIFDHHGNGNRSISIFKDYVFPSRYAEIFYDFLNESFKLNSKKKKSSNG